MDLTITPVNVRIAATLAVAQISAQNGGPATGIQVSLEVDFPVAIPLADSGLGIYGLVGLFAMNFQRDPSLVTDNTVMAPALAWLKATHGDVANPKYWVPKINSWDFGVGALLGTEGTDIIFNMKGMVLLELPGPNLLIMMKANVLFPMPELQGDAEGTILAVIDLDFARGTMTIGLAIDFVVQPLIEINIPIEAFFDFNDTSDWHLYLGQYSNQVQAKVLLVFDASGYVMLSGNGIPAHNNLPAVTGFSIAAGLLVSFKWGVDPVYAELAAGFDAVIGFSPFRMAGKMNVRGTLHLFIVDISAWADLDVDVGEDQNHNKLSNISGDICGKVDFLFFSVSGCVHFTLSATTVPIPDPPDLVKSLKLISRSPALVIGTGVDKPIDSSLADAVEGDSGAPQSGVPVVPIDIVPVLMMVVPPLQDPSLTFNGQAIGGTPQAPSDGFVQRGDVSYEYTHHQGRAYRPAHGGRDAGDLVEHQGGCPGARGAARAAELGAGPDAQGGRLEHLSRRDHEGEVGHDLPAGGAAGADLLHLLLPAARAVRLGMGPIRSRLSGSSEYGAVEPAGHEPACERAMALRRSGGRPHAGDRAGRSGRRAGRVPGHLERQLRRDSQHRDDARRRDRGRARSARCRRRGNDRFSRGPHQPAAARQQPDPRATRRHVADHRAGRAAHDQRCHAAVCGGPAGFRRNAREPRPRKGAGGRGAAAEMLRMGAGVADFRRRRAHRVRQSGQGSGGQSRVHATEVQAGPARRRRRLPDRRVPIHPLLPLDPSALRQQRGRRRGEQRQ